MILKLCKRLLYDKIHLVPNKGSDEYTKYIEQRININIVSNNA